MAKQQEGGGGVVVRYLYEGKEVKVLKPGLNGDKVVLTKPNDADDGEGPLKDLLAGLRDVRDQSNSYLTDLVKQQGGETKEAGGHLKNSKRKLTNLHFCFSHRWRRGRQRG